MRAPRMDLILPRLSRFLLGAMIFLVLGLSFVANSANAREHAEQVRIEGLHCHDAAVISLGVPDHHHSPPHDPSNHSHDTAWTVACTIAHSARPGQLWAALIAPMEVYRAVPTLERPPRKEATA